MNTAALYDSAEIVIGLVAAVGTDLTAVADELADVLDQVDYQAERIRLSSQLRRSGPPEIVALLDTVREDGPADDRILANMNAGDEFRARYGKNAMAYLAIEAIQRARMQLRQNCGADGLAPGKGNARPTERRRPGGSSAPAQGEPADRVAYILHQLKRPEEVKCLRAVYGPAFVLIAVHSPREQRVDDLADRIARTRHRYQGTPHRARAEALIQRDEEDAEQEHGQKVGDTFHMADVFLTGNDGKRRREELERFVQLLFGNTLHTPTRDEMVMFHARAAALQSASLGRQVGAAIATDGGDIIATGTNEVPRAGGGLYWPDDEMDRRDHQLGEDPSDTMKRDVLADILERLQYHGWLSAKRRRLAVNYLLLESLYGPKIAEQKATSGQVGKWETGPPPALHAAKRRHAVKIRKSSVERDPERGRHFPPVVMKDAHFMNLIEFMRPVHAEMAAICDASRRGVPLNGTVLYATTFPCHGCAKHIVAAGVKRVVYIEPYPKSLTLKLYNDSIAVDPAGPRPGYVRFQPFVGIAPRRFVDWFSKGDRKNDDGSVARWDGRGARPRLGDWVPTLDVTVFREDNALLEFAGKQRSDAVK